MRVVAVLRKPLEGTVAQNCLTYGTGALNVDGCRIATSDGKPHYSASKYPNGAKGWGFHGGVGGRESDGSRSDVPVTASAGGRWPSNVILQHLDGCEQDGVKKVKACGVGAFTRSTGKENGGQTGAAYGAESRSVGTEQINYADKDGKETIANWICEDGCPVAELDAQSGVRTSFPRTLSKEHHTGCATSFKRGSETSKHGDTGGASRFFKQVKK